MAGMVRNGFKEEVVLNKGDLWRLSRIWVKERAFIHKLDFHPRTCEIFFIICNQKPPEKLSDGLF